MTAAPAPARRRPTLWPWLVLGGFLIGILAMRLLGASFSARDMPVLAALPPFELRDQTGARFGSQELLGKVWIASFIYTSCPGPCPRVVQQLANVQRQLGEEPDLRAVSISVDPAADTSEVLAVYGKQRAIDPEHWKLLTGDPKDVFKLVRGGFLVAMAPSEDVAPEVRASEGPVVHSTHLVLVDRAMQVRGYYESTDPEATARLVTDTRKLLRSRSA